MRPVPAGRAASIYSQIGGTGKMDISKVKQSVPLTAADPFIFLMPFLLHVAVIAAAGLGPEQLMSPHRPQVFGSSCLLDREEWQD